MWNKVHGAPLAVPGQWVAECWRYQDSNKTWHWRREEVLWSSIWTDGWSMDTLHYQLHYHLRSKRFDNSVTLPGKWGISIVSGPNANRLIRSQFNIKWWVLTVSVGRLLESTLGDTGMKSKCTFIQMRAHGSTKSFLPCSVPQAMATPASRQFVKFSMDAKDENISMQHK